MPGSSRREADPPGQINRRAADVIEHCFAAASSQPPLTSTMRWRVIHFEQQGRVILASIHYIHVSERDKPTKKKSTRAPPSLPLTAPTHSHTQTHARTLTRAHTRTGRTSSLSAGRRTVTLSLRHSTRVTLSCRLGLQRGKSGRRLDASLAATRAAQRRRPFTSHGSARLKKGGRREGAAGGPAVARAAAGEGEGASSSRGAARRGGWAAGGGGRRSTSTHLTEPSTCLNVLPIRFVGTLFQEESIDHFASGGPF